MAIAVLAVLLAYWLYQRPCKESAYHQNSDKAPSRIIGPYQNPAAYQYSAPDKENKYGENDLEVQTRIANSGDITACWSVHLGIAAIVISIFAFVIGIYQWVLSAHQSRQELRAYVYPTGIFIMNHSDYIGRPYTQEELRYYDPGKGPGVQYGFKNFGKTPAFEVFCQVVVAPFFNGEAETFKQMESKMIRSDVPPSMITIPPEFHFADQVHHSDHRLTDIVAFNGTPLPSLLDGRSQLYIRGLIKYRDIFGYHHSHEFLFAHGSHSGGFGKGNHAIGVTSEDKTEPKYWWPFSLFFNRKWREQKLPPIAP